MVGRIKNMLKNKSNPEKNRKLKLWQGRFQNALDAYNEEIGGYIKQNKKKQG